MREFTVAAGAARGLMDFAVSKGATRERLLRRAGIDLATLENQDNRIALPAYVALMKAGQDLCQDPALALHYAEAVNLADISIVGLIGDASETMLDAFAQLNRYGRLVVEVDTGAHDRFKLVKRENGLWVVDQRPQPNTFPELTEATFARMISGTRRFGQTPFVLEVHVTHAAPSYRAEYDRVFGARTVFNAKWNAMRIDEAWLGHRIALQPKYVFGVLSDRAEALLEQLENAKTTRGQVERAVMPVLHTGAVSIDGIAAKLGTSRQTLYRRLKAEGVTFESVLDEMRRQLALNYVGGGKASVNEVAYLVGFSDPAAFSRAFKRWTGQSPRAMRARKE